MECQFCGENLEALYALDEVAFCLRCGAAMMFTTDLSDVRRLLAEAVFHKPHVSREEVEKIHVVVVPDVDVDVLPKEQSEAERETEEESLREVARVHLAVGWDPDELLSTAQVARILGISKERAAHLVAEGKFPNAVRTEPKCPRSRRGYWRIPRRDVADWMRRRRRKK